LVKIGKNNPLEVGNETVMFRHEKTFFHQTGIAIQLGTSEGESTLEQKIREIEEYKVERVGEELQTDLFLITHDSPEKDSFWIVPNTRQCKLEPRFSKITKLPSY